MLVFCDCAPDYNSMEEIGGKQHSISGILYFRCKKCKRMTKITQAHRKHDIRGVK